MDSATVGRQAAMRHQDATAVVCDGHRQTYGQLHERACRLVNALAALGVAKGDRVAMLGDNSPETVEQLVGLAYGGYVRSALYTHNAPAVNAALLDAIGATALLVQRCHYEAITPHLEAAPGVAHVLVFDGEDCPSEAIDYEDALAEAAVSDARVPVALHDNAVLRFSAGTTGVPKGIVHTVAGWGALGAEMGLIMPPLSSADRYLAAGPLTHATSMPVSPVIAAGGALVLMRAFEPGAFLRLIEQERCTIGFGVPAMIHAAATHPDAASTDVSSLRALIYGGAPMNETTLGLALGVFGDVMLQLYGQSEGAPMTTLSPADHHVDGGRLLRSAGRPTPSSAVTIRAEDGSELPIGEVGEVAVRTPTAMAEIWDDPAATAARLLPDGSVRTRDMGYLDEQGYLFLTDRKEDMIISGGHNIWPAELENALAAHPAVDEVAVVGVAHERWGETPLAAVVLVDGQRASEDELIAWTRERVGAIKKVTAVVFVDELPKTPIGKVLRRSIRDQHAPATETAR